jgi:hypothetical protein
MIRDARTTFATAVSVAASAGTAVFGNYIDRTTSPNVDQARLYLVIFCTTAIITGGSAGTVGIDLISSAATSGSSPNIHITSPLWVTGSASVAPLTAGSLMLLEELPRGSGVVGIGTYLRYIMLQCITATTTTTAGAVSAFLSLETGYTNLTGYPNASQ